MSALRPIYENDGPDDPYGPHYVAPNVGALPPLAEDDWRCRDCGRQTPTGDARCEGCATAMAIDLND